MTVEQWALVACLLAPVFWSLSNVLDKIAIDGHVDSSVEFMFFLSQFYLIVALFGFFLIDGAREIDVYAILCGGLLYVLYLFYSFALENADVSVVVPLHQVEPVFVVTLSFFTFGYLPQVSEFLGFALLSIGILVIYAPRRGGEKGLISRRGLAALLISAGFGALSTVLAERVLDALPLPALIVQTSLGYGLAGLSTLVLPSVRRSARAWLFGPKAAKLLLFGGTGAFDLGGYVLFFGALSLSDRPGLVAMLVSVHPFYVVVLGLAVAAAFPTLLGEAVDRGAIARKLAGSLFIVAGVATMIA